MWLGCNHIDIIMKPQINYCMINFTTPRACSSSAICNDHYLVNLLFIYLFFIDTNDDASSGGREKKKKKRKMFFIFYFCGFCLVHDATLTSGVIINLDLITKKIKNYKHRFGVAIGVDDF